MTVGAIQEVCSVCGHSRFYHEKLTHDCLVGGINDDPSGHSFAGTKRTLWEWFVPDKLPVPIFYMPVEGNVLDTGGFGMDGTWTGTEGYTDGPQGDTNNALVMDGLADFVTCDGGDENKFDINMRSKLSVCCWFKTSDPSAQIMIGKKSTQGDNSAGWILNLNASERPLWKISNGTVSIFAQGSTTQYDDGVWHHIVATKDDTATDAGCKIYIDGVLHVTGSGTDVEEGSCANAFELLVGINGISGNFWGGNLSELAVWDFELDAEQVAFLYNSGAGRKLGFNLRTGCILYSKLNGNLNDEIGTNALSLNAGTEQYVQSLLDPNAQAFDFDGLTQLETNNPTNFGFVATDKFSFSFWVKLTAPVTTRVEPLSRRNGQGKGYYAQFEGGFDNEIYSGIETVTPGANVTYRDNVDGMDTAEQEWVHVVCTYDGSQTAAGWKMYFNGANNSFQVAGDAPTGDFDNGDGLFIGGNDGSGHMTGQMQHVAVWTRELSEAEVDFLYNGGTPLDF